MRRAAMFTLVLSLGLTAGLSGCGQAPAGLDLRVGGPFGARPTIAFPGGKPSAELRIDQLVAGAGTELRRDDVAIVQYTAHVWDGRRNRLVDSSFNRGTPAAFPVGRMLKGLDTALVGRRVGSRVAAAIPPKDGFGADPPRGLKAADGLVYVVDILGTYHQGASAGTAGGSMAGVTVRPGVTPALHVPAAPAPRAFVSKVLLRGKGPVTRAGQLLVTQHEGAVWGSRRVFDSSWRAGRPKAFALGVGDVLPGWDRALSGVPVGSRVVMVLPPAYGYGTAGLPAAGITATDTLAFVVDVLAAY